MWWLTTADGRQVDESQMPWPRLPADIVIRSLGHGPVVLTNHNAYGFQRYRLDTMGGRVGGGVQLIGIDGDKATITDIDDHGVVRRKTVHRRQLTYAPELLRRGVG